MTGRELIEAYLVATFLTAFAVETMVGSPGANFGNTVLGIGMYYGGLLRDHNPARK